MERRQKTEATYAAVNLHLCGRSVQNVHLCVVVAFVYIVGRKVKWDICLIKQMSVSFRIFFPLMVPLTSSLQSRDILYKCMDFLLVGRDATKNQRINTSRKRLHRVT